jgi:hypothetical protein
MLTINKIGDLQGKELNAWKILDAGEGRKEIGKDIYVLTFARLDNVGNVLDDRAGVIIDRNINPLLKGYHIRVVYESWDYEIDTIVWTVENIGNKNAFFGMVLHKINEEYYKRKQK